MVTNLLEPTERGGIPGGTVAPAVLEKLSTAAICPLGTGTLMTFTSGSTRRVGLSPKPVAVLSATSTDPITLESEVDTTSNVGDDDDDDDDNKTGSGINVSDLNSVVTVAGDLRTTRTSPVGNDLIVGESILIGKSIDATGRVIGTVMESVTGAFLKVTGVGKLSGLKIGGGGAKGSYVASGSSGSFVVGVSIRMLIRESLTEGFSELRLVDKVKGTVSDESLAKEFIISGTLRESTEIVFETELKGTVRDESLAKEFISSGTLSESTGIVFETELAGSDMSIGSKATLFEASMAVENSDSGTVGCSKSIVFGGGSSNACSDKPTCSTEKLFETSLAVGKSDSGTLVGSKGIIFGVGSSNATGKIEGNGVVGILRGEMVVGICSGLIVGGGVCVFGDAAGIIGSTGIGISIGLGLVGA